MTAIPNKISGILNNYQATHIKEVIIGPNTEFLADDGEGDGHVFPDNPSNNQTILTNLNLGGNVQITIFNLKGKENFGDLSYIFNSQYIFPLIIMLVIVCLFCTLFTNY